MPDLDHIEIRQQAERGGDNRHGDLADKQHLAAAVHIRHQTAEQRKDQDGQETRHTDTADYDRLIRKCAQMPEQRPQLHL